MFSVSYDSVETLADFASEHGIDFPMLSDTGSRVIRRLGLLNEIVPTQAAAYGMTFRSEYEGVPHPGTFVLDADGTIVDRWFEVSYRLRASGAAMMERLTNRLDASAATVSAEANGNGVSVRAWSADSSYRPWTEIVVHVDVAIDTGMHLYGNPIPPGYHALGIGIRSQDAMYVGPTVLPEGTPFTMQAIDESFVVYEDFVRADVAISLTEERGPVVLDIDVSYQACTDKTCFMPETVTLQLPLNATGHDKPVPPLPRRD